MKRILFVVIAAMSIQLVRSAETSAPIERPEAEKGPTQGSVGIWIVDITNIDSAQQNFTADIAVVLRWRDAYLRTQEPALRITRWIKSGPRE